MMVSFFSFLQSLACERCLPVFILFKTVHFLHWPLLSLRRNIPGSLSAINTKINVTRRHRGVSDLNTFSRIIWQHRNFVLLNTSLWILAIPLFHTYSSFYQMKIIYSIVFPILCWMPEIPEPQSQYISIDSSFVLSPFTIYVYI